MQVDLIRVGVKLPRESAFGALHRKSTETHVTDVDHPRILHPRFFRCGLLRFAFGECLIQLPGPGTRRILRETMSAVKVKPEAVSVPVL